MEEKLRRLFDASTIVTNNRLDAMIADTMSRYGSGRVELTDDETEYLAAAGTAEAAGKKEADRHWKNGDRR